MPPRPRTIPMTILARDPLVEDPRSADPARKILRASVDVPAGRMAPGPRGGRFHVVDFDTTRHKYTTPRALGTPSDPWGYRDRFADLPDRDLLSDPRFWAQNVYAIAARTLAFFEAALGRPVPWAFASSQLYLVPSAFLEANAFYSDDDMALLFGYFRVDGQDIRTCLAHDIVAHETTHAILDGLRNRFDSPGLPDQAGFHEGFADVVALLSILSTPESIEPLIGGRTGDRVPAKELTFDALRESVLVTIGSQFGNALHLNRGQGLRRSATMEPTVEWKNLRNPEWREPHRRGEILVAAVLQTYLHMWTNRLTAITGGGTLDRRRAAEEGATAARHLLTMCIRAIDFCPPVEFELADFLTAVVASETEVDPGQEFSYVEALRAGFGVFGIQEDLSGVWTAPDSGWPSHREFSYGALRSDPDETFRYFWDNADFLGINPSYYLHVENVRPAVRTGPRGFVIFETVVDYVQELIAPRAELEAEARLSIPGFSLPASIPPAAQIKVYGGGTVIFDEFGTVKYHRSKPLDDWARQQRRIQYLLDQGLWDTKGRLGFSFGATLGQRFAAFHTAYRTDGEEW